VQLPWQHYSLGGIAQRGRDRSQSLGFVKSNDVTLGSHDGLKVAVLSTASGFPGAAQSE
jgi:hypothetical protein